MQSGKDKRTCKKLLVVTVSKQCYNLCHKNCATTTKFKVTTPNNDNFTCITNFITYIDTYTLNGACCTNKVIIVHLVPYTVLPVYVER